jgi:hypothetical protein
MCKQEMIWWLVVALAAAMFVGLRVISQNLARNLRLSCVHCDCDTQLQTPKQPFQQVLAEMSSFEHGNEENPVRNPSVSMIESPTVPLGKIIFRLQ